MTNARAVSPVAIARLAGALYLLCIAAGFFAEFFARERLIVGGDAVRSAQHIVAAQGLYRLGFFADLTALTSGTVICVLFYLLLRPVSPGIALLDLVLGVASNVVSLAAAAHLYAPLVILSDAPYLQDFSWAQRAGLALFSLRLYVLAYAVNLGLFGLECLTTGYLIYRSTFLPRLLGVLLVIGGAGYLTNSFVDFMPPGFGAALFPYVLLPALLAEGALALWLLCRGVDARRWAEVAARAGPRS